MALELSLWDRSPPGISQAWVQGGQLWMVPQKNQQIQAVTSADGKTVRWSASGEYVVVKQPPKGLRIQINGDWRDLRLN